MDPADWLAWWPIIAAVAGGAFTFIAWAAGLFSKHGTDRQDRQQAREENVSTKASDLIDQYQEELKEKRKELQEIKQQCVTDLANLRARADDVERRLLERIGALERQVESLQLECSNLRMQL